MYLDVTKKLFTQGDFFKVILLNFDWKKINFNRVRVENN